MRGECGCQARAVPELSLAEGEATHEEIAAGRCARRDQVSAKGPGMAADVSRTVAARRCRRSCVVASTSTASSFARSGTRRPGNRPLTQVLRWAPVRAGRLHSVLEDYAIPPAHWQAVFPSNRTLSAKVVRPYVD